jgi:hypothetical protein
LPADPMSLARRAFAAAEAIARPQGVQIPGRHAESEFNETGLRASSRRYLPGRRTDGRVKSGPLNERGPRRRVPPASVYACASKYRG